jgi:Flp pilus assembly protein TadG
MPPLGLREPTAGAADEEVRAERLSDDTGGRQKAARNVRSPAMRVRFGSARGSVSVEFAAVLPLVAVSLLLVAQIGLLVSEQLAVQHAAREGARAAAVWNDDARARDAALNAGNLDPARTTS